MSPGLVTGVGGQVPGGLHSAPVSAGRSPALISLPNSVARPSFVGRPLNTNTINLQPNTFNRVVPGGNFVQSRPVSVPTAATGPALQSRPFQSGRVIFNLQIIETTIS